MAESLKGVTVEVLSQDVERAMVRFAREVGVTLKDVYVDQMRLATNQLIRVFPPKTKKQGANRIGSELSNLFVEVGPSHFDMVQHWSLIGGDVPAEYFKTARGKVFGVERKLMNLHGDRGKMKAYHQRNRLKSGRTTAAGSWDKRIGRWKFIDRMVVRESGVKGYTKTVQKKVGMLKHGWIPTNAPFAIKAPNWVKNAPGGPDAVYRDQMSPLATGFLKLTNRVPWSGKHEGLVKIVLRTRSRDLAKFARKRLDRRIAQFNKGRA